MRFRGIGIPRQVIRRMCSPFKSSAAILLYHRIAELRPDPQLLCVTPAHFAEHLECLLRHYRPISLRAFGQALASGDVPRKTVVVTLDDGYADNLWNAKPLLERYSVPATVFVTDGYVDRDRELPSDILERCLLGSKTLPHELRLVIEGKAHSWQIDDPRDGFSTWNVAMKLDPTSRHRCYRELHSLLRPLNDADRKDVLNTLVEWASCPISARNDRRVLDSDELKGLSEDGLVEIGAHGSDHLVLAAHPVELQWKDLYESKQHLEGILGKPVTSFAYPYGRPSDANIQTIDLVKKAGFQVACANIPAPATGRSDPFWLPRFLVRDSDRQEFAERMKEMF